MQYPILTISLCAALSFAAMNVSASQNPVVVGHASIATAGQTANLGNDEIGTQYCEDVSSDFLQGGDMRAFGSEVVADNNFRLRATGLPNNVMGFFLVGEKADLVQNPAGSLGDLCLGGKLGRFNRPEQILNTGSTGSYVLMIDLMDFPMNPTQSVMAGETWYFQSWFRVPALAEGTNSSSNFTNGVEVSFL